MRLRKEGERQPLAGLPLAHQHQAHRRPVAGQARIGQRDQGHRALAVSAGQRQQPTPPVDGRRHGQRQFGLLRSVFGLHTAGAQQQRASAAQQLECQLVGVAQVAACAQQRQAVVDLVEDAQHRFRACHLARRFSRRAEARRRGAGFGAADVRVHAGSPCRAGARDGGRPAQRKIGGCGLRRVGHASEVSLVRSDEAAARGAGASGVWRRAFPAFPAFPAVPKAASLAESCTSNRLPQPFGRCADGTALLH